MGYFNVVRDDTERFGSQFHSGIAKKFNDFINYIDLIDVPMGGPRFTWSEKWESKFSKLDRFLVSEGIMLSFFYITGMVLDKYIPDHRPILLLEHCLDYDPTPFRIFHSWFMIDGFDDIVRDSWSTASDGGILIILGLYLRRNFTFLNLIFRLDLFYPRSFFGKI